MKINKYEFFREAVGCICSSLDIAVVMRRCVRHLKNVMPADQIILTFYDQRLNAIRTIARATSEKGVQEDMLIRIDNHTDLAREIKNLPRENICNDTTKEALNNKMARAYGMEDYSLLQMFLETRDQKFGLGYLILCAKGKHQYTPAHLELFTMLREPFTLASANILQHRKVLKTSQTLEDDRRYLQNELHHLAGDTIIGSKGGLKSAITKVRQVATKSSPVLINGETGVGKDIIANMIHTLSHRSPEPFIKVNCGAIPDELIDSELFGHEKGAFTGAVQQKRGRFERAQKGTLFLDEIGEMSPRSQIRLLRVLQNKEFERVGGTQMIELDVRIIAATNKSLENEVIRNRFREDLWYRLNVFPIDIPPLRERKTDIPDLARYFIRIKSEELQLPFHPSLTQGSLDRMMSYDWPGNVRELQNLIERGLILSHGEPLYIDPFQTSGRTWPRPAAIENPESLRLDDATIRHIEKVLAITHGKIHGPGGAAHLLDINAGTLRHRMNKLGIPYGRKKGRYND